MYRHTQIKGRWCKAQEKSNKQIKDYLKIPKTRKEMLEYIFPHSPLKVQFWKNLDLELAACKMCD
jgi:hypothetical protein